jgi:hypothetical protein
LFLKILQLKHEQNQSMVCSVQRTCDIHLPHTRPPNSIRLLPLRHAIYQEVFKLITEPQSRASSFKGTFSFLHDTPLRRVLLEKLTIFHPVKKFPAFYGTRRFIIAFTSARQLFLS